jgi:predicted kinase
MIVIIHGAPAVGKSTLARALSEALEIPMLSRDVLAEELHTAQDSDGQGCSAGLQHRAHDLLFERLAAAARHGLSLIVEATLNPDRAAQRLVPLLTGTDQRVFEVFLEAPADVLVHRYRQRGRAGRHRVHRDAQREPQLAAHLRACRYRPLGVGHSLVRVDTDVPPGEVLALVLAVIDPSHGLSTPIEPGAGSPRTPQHDAS